MASDVVRTYYPLTDTFGYASTPVRGDPEPLVVVVADDGRRR
jgi:hypothetical protein